MPYDVRLYLGELPEGSCAHEKISEWITIFEKVNRIEGFELTKITANTQNGISNHKASKNTWHANFDLRNPKDSSQRETLLRSK